MDRTEENIEQETTPENESGEENSHPMDAFLEDTTYGMDSPRRGEIRTGTIARITDSDILVDIGFKSEGIIPGRELEHLPEETRAELTIGSEVTVFVLRTGGTVLLSLSRAEEEKDWIDAQDLLKSKEVFEGVISGYNKGGLIVKLGGIRGFIPASQVSIARRWRADGDSPDQRWGKMVGEPIAAKVIEVERRRNRLILSERAAAREARDILKQRLIAELEPGEERKGHVISLADFGAFIDIGGADGLVHTSEISWKRITHPREELKVGQEVEVKVLSVDSEQNRISLSIRELLPDPWDTIVEQFQEGQLVEGVITKLTKFGAFASLRGISDYEVEGLVHISELSDRHIVHPREVVSEDEILTLRIIRVDKERRRIGLSLKRVDSPEYAELDWQAAMKELAPEEEPSDVTDGPKLEEEDVEESELAEQAAAEADAVTGDEAVSIEAEAVEVIEEVAAEEEITEADETEAVEVTEATEDVVEELELSENLVVVEVDEGDESIAAEEEATDVSDEIDVRETPEVIADVEEVEDKTEDEIEAVLEEASTEEPPEEIQALSPEDEALGGIIEEQLPEDEEEPALKDEPDAPNEDEDNEDDGAE